MSTNPINVALFNEHTLFSKVFKNYLEDQDNIRVSFHASELFDLLRKLDVHSANVLLTDLFVDQRNVMETLDAIRSKYPGIRILVLSWPVDVGLISDLLDLGIHGYISTMDDPEEVLRAIIAVSNGKLYRNKLFTEALYLNRQHSASVSSACSLMTLDDREKKILQLLWEEKSNKEIADEIFLSVRSIEKIRQDMKQKLGIRSTIGLLKYAIEKKIIRLAY
ncbi:response regulator transcription factor [Chitinophaga qingshengii]|uniref:Response regulator transcription factor n=1 Tax=Chitinophaga qingshengii TaxID=1569794 RepID=A0ABR7TG49_9BACT|nr:response regulator transcription factor [Chitinophaga qingshengii]MBC9929329.1 response regulator transcription factor [Chitinophaga qingshengii]